MENKTIAMDFYELTMAQTYFMSGKKEEVVYFDLFFRKNPFNGGYTISNGLDEIIEYVKNFKFEEDDIEFLRSLDVFNEEFLEYLKNLKFTGDIYAVPNGTPVFPNEPVLVVKAKLIEAQMIESALLNCFNHGALVTTAAKRITNEAKGIPVMEFGLRRAPGLDSAINASKFGYIGGCVGTSNVAAGKKYGVPLFGTMAHSLVTEADTEYEAFLNYAKANPDNCVFLVDTYNTLQSGTPNGIRVANDYLVPNGYHMKGVRIDSGDLAYLSKEVRRILDESGLTKAAICLSNGLDEYTISELLKQGACIDSIGCGDNIAAPKERVGGVYKLSALIKDGKIIPKIKISNDSIKTTTPGAKKVYRFYDKETGYALGDVVALYDEKIPLDKYTLVHPVETWKKTTLENYDVKELLVPIFKKGKLVYKQPKIKETKKYCEEQFETLYPEVKRLSNPHEYYVDLSKKLLKLKQELIALYTNQEEKGKQLVKR